MKKVLKGVFWTLISLVALVCLCLGLALSPWGTQQLLGYAKSKGWIEYQSVSGAPLDDLTLTGASLDTAGLSLRADTLRLDWSSDCLTSGALCIDDLTGQNIDVTLKPAPGEAPEAEEASNGGGRISTPIPLEVRNLDVDQLNVTLANGARLGWARFTSGLRFEGHTIHIDRTELVDPFYDATAVTPSTDPAPAPAKTGSAIDNPLKALDQEPSTDRIDLPGIVLPVDIDLPFLAVKNARITSAPDTPQTIETLELAVQTRDSHIKLERAHLEAPQGRLDLNGEITLSDNYPMTFDLDSRINAAPFTGQSLALSLTGDASKASLVLKAEGDVTASVEGNADMLAPRLPFDINLTAQKTQWPFKGVPTYSLDTLTARLSGDLDGYRLAIDGTGAGPEVSSLALNARGSGNATSFDWQTLRLETPKGRLSSEGTLSWAEGIAARATLDLASLNLGALTPSVSGSLNGQGKVEFTQQPEGPWSVDMPGLKLTGTVQNRPFQLDTALSGTSDMRWDIERFALRQGPNRVRAEGTLSDTYNLDATIDAPNLSTLLPTLAGRLDGTIALSGSAEKPVAKVRLEGRSLAFNTLSIGQLGLSATSSGKTDPRLDVDLSLDELQTGAQIWSSIALTLDGRLSDHQLALDAKGGPNNAVDALSSHLAGRFDQLKQRYTATIDQLGTTLSRGDRIALNEPLRATVRLDQSRAHLEPFCLVREQGGSLCLSEAADLGADKGAMTLSLNDIPMSVANSALPDGWQASGTTLGNIDLAWQNQATRWQADGELRSTLDLEGQAADGSPWQLPQTRARLSLDATQSRARADLDLDLSEAGKLGLEVNVDDPMGARSLDGALTVDRLQLEPYQPLAAQLDTLKGQLNGRVALSGSTIAPRLNGQLTLDQVRVSGRDIPVALDDARVALNLQGDHGTLDGALTSGDATWDLGGQASWPESGNWDARVTLDGADQPLLASLPAYGRVRVAPDLQVEATPERLAIGGTVRIPWGRIEVDALPPSAVSPSKDEVILTREEAAQTDQALEQGELPDWATGQALEEAGMDLDVNVNVLIGDDVTLNAYGLASNLNGTLRVRQSRGTLQLLGDIDLSGGRFKAYGQNLIIRKGKVTFNGPPAEPYLDFRAIRDPDTIEDDNIIVGLQVTGSASQPNIQVFSDPEMNETAALSYLLRGRAPDDSGDSDNALASALIGLSVSQSGRAIGSLGENFGIQDLTLDTAGSGDSSQVVVSGYLFDGLKVSYGVGMFSSIAELTLRYKLIQSLYLEAVSGTNQALDLIYTFSLGKAKTPAEQRTEE
ncbi:autotransporter assembly complex protein TamB [Larsenimonas salina]|uniref:autotransporter assembly complex protein TamB n=1 Tax=Larsenimonas salina TaxID=1295565 RepID=UPI0020743BAA|nr:translocation/assembly module TamB domain-containing protein [Larsenimonas salina]MCM5703458.1 translocation/assembly module TamB [Larsenimonas salina]